MVATVTVLSAGAIRRGITKVSQIFERESGTSVTMDFTSAPKVRARVLAGELVDVVIASTSALDALASASRIVPASRAVVGRTWMAVMMRKGVSAPDLSSMAAFRQAMLDSDVLVYNEGSSGAYAAMIVDKLGLRDPMGSRICVAQNGAQMIEIITSHTGRALGLAQLTNVLDQVAKGIPVVLAGLFPDEIQNATSYEIAVSASSRAPKLGEELVRTFASAEAKKLLVESGLD